MRQITVLAELEELDDTTDAIVWLIEQKFSDIKVPTLTVDKISDRTWGGLETLDKQTGHLEGWRVKRVSIYFEAKMTDIPAGKDEEDEEIYDEGYKIIVEDVSLEMAIPSKTRIKTEYTIKGAHRKDFAIVEG